MLVLVDVLLVMAHGKAPVAKARKVKQAPEFRGATKRPAGGYSQGVAAHLDVLEMQPAFFDLVGTGKQSERF